MLSLLTNHPLISALVLILIDLGLWRLISANGSNWKLVVRLVIFALFSVLLFNEGMNRWSRHPGPITYRCTWRPRGCRSAGGCSARAP